MSNPTNYRATGEQHLAAASEATKEADGEDNVNLAHYHLTTATNQLLLAVYDEMRHGNDQQTKALDELTAAIGSLTDRPGGTQ